MTSPLPSMAVVPMLIALHAANVVGQVPTELDAKPITVGHEVLLESKILDGKQKVLIYVPEEAGNERQRYPVILVLDGEYTFLHTVSAANFLAANGKMPAAIVVGVCSEKRLTDFTPQLSTTPREGLDASGGADKFLEFLAEELLPYLDKNYPTQPFHVLMGHSLGGLFAMHAMIHRPELYSGIITLEPALWWDDRSMIGRVEEYFEQHPQHKGRLIMVEATSVEGWRNDWAKLAPHAPRGLYWEMVDIPGESHEGMAFRGRYEGLKALFKHYVPQMRYNASRATLEALEQQYGDLSEDYGYDVAIPELALREVALRATNRHDHHAAVQTLARAAELYPTSTSVREMLSQAKAAAASAPIADADAKPSFAAVEQGNPYLGAWEGTLKTEPGMPMEISVVFENAHGQLKGYMLARGVAADGGDFRMDVSSTRIDADTLAWDRPDNNGGTHIHTARLANDRTLVGKVLLAGGNPLPAGFAPPKVTFSLRKKDRAAE